MCASFVMNSGTSRRRPTCAKGSQGTIRLGDGRGRSATRSDDGRQKDQVHRESASSLTQAEIEKYKERHPLGTKPRLAFDLLRFTTGRREDAPRLGPRHIQDDRIRLIQAKNEHRKPVEIDIPLHPDLKASIKTTRLVARLSWSPNGENHPHPPVSAMRCVIGSTKPTCITVPLTGYARRRQRRWQRAATPHELMAVTGHQSLEEVERYTGAAERRSSPIEQWRSSKDERRSSPPCQTMNIECPTLAVSGTIRTKRQAKSVRSF